MGDASHLHLLMPRELATVLVRLRRAGIACHAYVEEQITVGVGLPGEGPFAEATFPVEAADRAAEWLHSSALILFGPIRPGPVASLVRWWRAS